ncbi:SDR family NAD(P)-dependent oxidoreductase [Alicyclobacillus fastidiosus]|uniref:SDR family NAD(P)-dependent oxidoreductase n=1 Tax=Alicyclobacillus fastidiosus TaxID=392011 RepID=UPI0034D5DAD4
MGRTSGIGLATTRKLTETGAKVIATRRDKGKLDASLKQPGPRARGAQVDATLSEDLKTFYSRQGSFGARWFNDQSI